MRCYIVNLNTLLIIESKQRECYIHKYIHTHIRTHAHTHTRTYAHTHIRIYVHTHIDKETLYLLYCVVAIYIVVNKKKKYCAQTIKLITYITIT